MKSALYVATTCRAYRRLIDAYAAGQLDEALLNAVATDLDSIPHRDYFSGSLETPAGPDSVFEQFSGVNRSSHKYVGQIIDTTADFFVLQLVEAVQIGDMIELLPFAQNPIPWQISALYTVTGHPISRMRQNSLVCIPRSPALDGVETMTVIRAAHDPVLELA